MYRFPFSYCAYALAIVGVVIACAPEPIEVPEDDGDGSSGTGTNGGTGFGGTSGTGFGGTGFGGTATGGVAPQGGTATGGFSGTPATGGFPTGGTPATGGTAGTPATGGTAGVGVTGGTAGTPAGGGAGGGAPPTTCDATFMVGADGFVRAPGASGCWSGYAYAGGDTGSTLTTMTSFGMCAMTGMPCTLRVAGTLGPATETNAYAGVVYLGFNVAQLAGSSTFGTATPTGTGLEVQFTKVAGPAIRVQIQAGTSRWCANLTTSPTTIPYAMFNTACWDNSGTAYAKQPIEAVQLVAPGGEMAQMIDMTLVSVKDL